MIIRAGKYTDVRGDTHKRGTAYPSHSRPRASVPALLLPKKEKLINWDEWLWRELREGGRLSEYLRIEKARTNERLRRVAQFQHRTGWQQNNRSDFQLLARVPARDYHRWQKTDPDFWRDKSNLKSYRRDNPEACIYL